MNINIRLAAATLALAAAPAVAAPSIDMPPPEASGDPSRPATALPRETAIENPLDPGSAMSGTALGGYGELTLNAPSIGPSVIDLRRLVLFVGHNFSDRIRFYSEIEVEHAVSSAADQGEVEIEQAYLDGLINRRLNVRGGLIIMPVGIINVYHEPPTFNGVDRPDVDTFVIPSTWREPGFGVFGELTAGVRYQLYVVNGFDASGFTAASAIREGHQEAQLARARDFGAVGRLDWEPRLGTDLGLSGYLATSGAGRAQDLPASVGSVPIGIAEIDYRTRMGGFTSRGEAAVLFVGDAGALNTALAAGSPDQMAAVPVASQSRGGYLEAAYDVLRLFTPDSLHSVTLFGRYDYADTQAAVPAGFTALPQFRRQTATLGLVWRPRPQIALKLDARRHFLGAGPSFNEIASAITWMF
jgi:hypothetical protein